MGEGANSVTTGEYMEAILPRGPHRVVAAHLTEQEYELARVTIPQIGAFKDY
jgi:hypothetical protein